MAEWIVSNLGSIFAGAAVLAAATLAVRSMVMDRRAGKSSCGGNCGTCGLCREHSLKSGSKEQFLNQQ